ncbi:unnamed protein product [Trichogramma brassicae]|uniref:Uncharacterized protein n=1 Tax=Trichogramma brassicae TaxID=86971 RepID=A0A6H5J5U4_9HYME|nr:unnamed protein product [Trichogramma brassicae]
MGETKRGWREIESFRRSSVDSRVGHGHREQITVGHARLRVYAQMHRMHRSRESIIESSHWMVGKVQRRCSSCSRNEFRADFATRRTVEQRYFICRTTAARLRHRRTYGRDTARLIRAQNTRARSCCVCYILARRKKSSRMCVVAAAAAIPLPTAGCLATQRTIQFPIFSAYTRSHFLDEKLRKQLFYSLITGAGFQLL